MPNLDNLQRSVAEIILAVQERGDQALCEFAQKWDRVSLSPTDLRVPQAAIDSADDSSQFAGAFRRACERIRRFHEAVKPRSVSVADREGVTMELRFTPIASVGLYVPGGKASYPSTLAMTAIPAQVAGAARIAVVTPPGPSGEVSPEVLLGAKILGLREIYRAGGAQAVAALALGTASIPRVDKIFGPGNAFVAEAKRQLFGVVGIDLVAGPSEIVVYADATSDPDWAASDLIAQAEHDESARAILIASSDAVLRAVKARVDARCELEPRRETIRAALERHGVFEVRACLDEAARRIDEIAPEHLSIQSAEPRALLARVRNAGAVYLGGRSPVALGDYYAGPNHVLPTGGSARFASCLSVEDFLKRSNVVEATEGFLALRGGDVETLAAGERLPAHASSIRARKVRSAGARPGLREAKVYGLVEEEGEVKLNQNESPWDVPAEVKEKIFARLRAEPWNRYPQRRAEELRERIARDSGLPRECVLLGTGSNLILQWLFEAHGGPGRLALIPRPSFSLYAMWGRVSETPVEEFRLGGDFSYPAEEIRARVLDRSPAITVLCLPNNPTGNELALGPVERIAEAVERTGGLLVIDEAYHEFAAKEFDRSHLPRERPCVALVRTYSKAFSAAGLRLGYLLASREVARELEKIVPPFHLSHFHAVAGMALWEEKVLFQKRVAEVLDERRRLQESLAAIPGVRALPSEGNFFLAEFSRSGAGAKRIFERLRERGILVRLPGDDPALKEHLRINAGTREENDRLVRELQSILKEKR